jgi:HSP20 family protein
MYAHLVRRPDVFSQLDAFRRSMDKALVERSARAADGLQGLTPANRALFPRLVVAQDDAGWTLTGDLPGWRAEELSLTVEDGVLTLAGESARQEEGWTPLRTERPSWKFKRSLRFADPVGEVSAELKDGVLRVTVARLPKPQPVTITVR